MMDAGTEIIKGLSGIFELDEKYNGDNPRNKNCIKHKRGLSAMARFEGFR